MFIKNKILYFDIFEKVNSYFNHVYLEIVSRDNPNCNVLSEGYWFSRDVHYKTLRLKKSDEKWFFHDDFMYDGNTWKETCFCGIVYGENSLWIARRVKDWKATDIVATTKQFWFDGE